MKQEKVCIGYDRDYPGSYAWPRYSVKCPDCGQHSTDYGEVTTTDKDGDEHCLCGDCAAKVIAYWPS